MKRDREKCNRTGESIWFCPPLGCGRLAPASFPLRQIPVEQGSFWQAWGPCMLVTLAQTSGSRNWGYIHCPVYPFYSIRADRSDDRSVPSWDPPCQHRPQETCRGLGL